MSEHKTLVQFSNNCMYVMYIALYKRLHICIHQDFPQELTYCYTYFKPHPLSVIKFFYVSSKIFNYNAGENYSIKKPIRLFRTCKINETGTGSFFYFATSSLRWPYAVQRIFSSSFRSFWITLKKGILFHLYEDFLMSITTNI